MIPHFKNHTHKRNEVCFFVKGSNLLLLPETRAVVRQGQNLELTCLSNETRGSYVFYAYNSSQNVIYGQGGDNKRCQNFTNQAILHCDFGRPWQFRLTLLNPVHNQTIFCSRQIHEIFVISNTTIFVQGKHNYEWLLV